MREFKKAPAISDVEAGNTVSIKVPTGKTVERVHIYHEGLAGSNSPAGLKNIKVLINGNVLSEWKDGNALQQLNSKYYGRNIVAGRVTIDFVEDDIFHTLQQGKFFSLGTSGLDTVQIEVEIASDATAPKLRAELEQSAPTPAGWLKKTRIFHHSAGVAGMLEIDSIPRPNLGRIGRIHIHKDGGDINSAAFEIDGVKWIDVPKASIEAINADAGRVNQTDYLTLDFVLQGDMFESVPLTDAIQDMRLKLDCASEGQVTLFVEYFDQYKPAGF